MAETVSIPNTAQVVPQGAVKLGSNVTLTETPTTGGIIPGAYYVDGTTVSFAKIEGGQITAVVPTYAAEPTDGMDLNVNAKTTDNAPRTLNSLVSSADYINNSVLIITSGMMNMICTLVVWEPPTICASTNPRSLTIPTENSI